MNNKLVSLGFLALLGLASCAERQSPPPQPSVVVGFADQAAAARLGAPVIEVRAANPQPLATAELVGPDGTVIAAAPGQLEPQVPADYPLYGPSVGFGVFGGSSSGVGTGVSVGVPIGGGGYDTATVPAGELLRSRALILVRDMAAYRRNWERSVIRLTFGAKPGEAVTAEIPAPAPGSR